MTSVLPALHEIYSPLLNLPSVRLALENELKELEAQLENDKDAEAMREAEKQAALKRKQAMEKEEEEVSGCLSYFTF